jgi:hypothetical protein
MLVWYDTPKGKTLVKHFNKLQGHFSNIPESDKCFKVTSHKCFAEYVFEPIVNDATITEGPPWTFPFVEFFKLVVKSKKWHHNMTSQSWQIENYDDDVEEQPLKFLIYSNWCLKDIVIITETGNTDESSDGDSDNISEASSHVPDGK